MPVPNPYLIHIELFWPDMTRPNQNQIARVRAFDVNGAVITDEGQSGYDPSNGGWQPVFLQNIAAFYPPREKPNLRFRVESTAEQVVHTTQVFDQIPSGSTVRIIIGQSDELVGGEGNWVVRGTLRRSNGDVIGAGTVQAFDITNGSVALLGTTTVSSAGTYSITYSSASFSGNGVPHSQPNLQVRAYDSMGQLLAESALRVGASNDEVVDLTVAGVPSPGEHRVFGDVENTVGLKVAGVLVQAYRVVWTTEGIEEVLLGALPSAADGSYEIFYTPPAPPHALVDCGPAPDEIHLIVYAKEGTVAEPGDLLAKAPPVSPAARDQRVDLVVDVVSAVATSEYTQVDAALEGCLGQTEAARWATLNQLGEREDYLSIMAQTSGVGFNLLRAYVSAWRMTGEINAEVPWQELGMTPLETQVVYALVRSGRGFTLAELLDVQPAAFFEAMVDAIEKGVIDRALEAQLDLEAAESLQAKWREVLAHYLGADTESWQAQLLELVFEGPLVKDFADVTAVRATPFLSSTQHDVLMPQQVSAGDLLIVLFANRSATSTSTVNTPGGWTALWSQLVGTGANAVRFSGYAKKALGNEDNTAVNFATPTAQHAAAQVYRVAAATWTGSIAEGVAWAAAAATGTSATINPPPLSPAWGSDTTLWLACAGHVREHALSSSPASYTDTSRTSSSVQTGNCTALSARRELTASSEDPGNFVIGTSSQWVAQTLAIRPREATGKKRKDVVAAHFEQGLPFSELLGALVAEGVLTAAEANDVRFVFELYDAVDQYFPLVKAVYLDKVNRGWQTIAELSTVPRDPTGTGSSWYEYANNQQSYATGDNRFPGDIPGSGSEEKARVYAQRLYDKFGAAEPQVRFVDEALAAAQSGDDELLEEAAEFLAAHPDFNLQTTGVDKYLTDEDIDLTPELVAKLKQLQRVHRLTPSFEAAAALVEAGLDSAVKIARIEEGQFIADHEEALGLTEAQAIHRKAKHYAAEVFSTVVRFNQSLEDMGGSQVLPAALNLQAAVTETFSASKKFPNWVTLFGSLYNCASKHCQTVLSPGAYMVDLLDNFLKPSIKKTLLTRRPDLAHIELTCANTDRSVPYIDLVNEILAAVIAPHEVPMRAGSNITEAQLSSAADPQHASHAENLALVLGVLQNGGYLVTERAVVKTSPLDAPTRREWIVEDDAWRFTVTTRTPPHPSGAPYVAFGAPQTSARGDDLEVFPEHANPGAEAQLSAAVFPLHLPLALAREEIELILSRRGTTRSEVLEVFRSELTPGSKLSDPALALAFLGLTPAEGSAVLSSGLPVRQYWGFPGTGNVSVPRPESPHIQVSGPWLEVMSQVSVFLHRAALTYAELLELLDTAFVHDPESGRVGLSASDAELLECNYNRFELVNLSEEALRRISFFLRLQRKLGWSTQALDRYLMLLDERAPEDGLVRVAQVARLAGELARPVASLLGYFADLDLRRTERHPKSLFDEVYLRGAPVSDEYQGMNRLAQAEALELTRENLAGYKNYVRGALRLSAADFEVLWDTVGPVLPEEPPEATVPLTVPQLSAMYRTADFCRAVGLSVKDFFVAKALLGIEPFPVDLEDGGLLPTFEAIEELRRLAASGLSARSWQYLLRHETTPGESTGPSAEELAEAHRRMAAIGGEILGRYPDVEAPSTELVGAALGEALSSDRVARLLDILRKPSAQISAEDESFLAASFEFLLGAEAAAFAALVRGTADAETRRELVWERLRPRLLSQARRDAALAVASDLFAARREVIDALLRRALGSVANDGASAWEDWILGLDGWVTETEHRETIVLAPAGEWRSRWIVPADGEYRFVARVNVTGANPAEITLEVDGELVEAGPAEDVDGSTLLTFAPLEQKGGASVPLRFMYSGADRVTLLVRRDEGDAEVLPASVLSPFDERAYLRLWKALTLVRGLALTPNELEYVIGGDLLLNELPLDESDGDVGWSDVGWFLDQLGLNRSVQLDQTTLFDLWRGAEELTVGEIATLTGWEDDDISSVLSLFTSPPSFLAAETWFVLQACIRLAARVDVPVRQLIDLVLSPPSAARASALRSALRAKYTADAWRSAFKPLRDRLRQRERDALVGYLTTRNVTVGGASRFFIDANDLLPFFLIDVEMEPDTLISRIRLALNSIQLFVQRVFIGLETQSALVQLDHLKEQWTWMQNYRVWEANRKVFLFPENWIEPELRDDKTELFRELEEQLAEEDVTNERAEQLLFDYVEGLSELSDLVVAGVCAEGRFSGGSTNVYHFVARTRSKPFTYYYRTFQGRQFTDGVFTPWRKIPLEIESDSVTPALAEGSLRILWPVVVLKENVSTGSSADALGSAAELRLMWSTLETKSGRWSKPRLGQGKVFDYQPVTVFSRDRRDDGPDTSYYHFQTASTADGGIAAAVFKTAAPSGADGRLSPTRIGTFIISPSGEDFGYDDATTYSIGNNWPIGSMLRRGAAFKTDQVVETQLGGDTFAFRESLPFFSKVTSDFRALVTNFGYLTPALNEPFLFETPGRRLFALNRGQQASIGLSTGLTQTALFTTFDHPVLPDIKSKLRAHGPSGIMVRLVQALPASTVRYYYNYSTNYLSSSTGSYTSGYNNRYSYYSTLYLGYHIAGDHQAWGVSQRDFESAMVPSTAVERPYPLPTVEFGYGTPYGVMELS